jgi:hypothetical protein
VLIAILVTAVIEVAGNAAGFSSYVRGERWDFNVTHEALAQTPSWLPEDASPPLSPRKAIEVAAKQLQELVTDPERWRFSEVALYPVGPNEKWVYLIRFSEPPPRPEGGSHSLLGILVLMNGATASPVRRPWPER